MMVRKENWIVLIIIIVLALLAAYFMLSDKSGSISSKDLDFSIGRTENVTEFQITGKDEQLVVKKMKGGWLANEHYRVKENLPEVFLKTINSIKVKAPASRETREILRNQLLNSKHIDVFKGRNKICSYYILFDSVNTQSTYLMKKWAKLPVEIEITGLQIPVASIYRNDLQYWKKNLILSFSSKEIEWVTMENSHDSSSSFRIGRTKQGALTLSSPDQRNTYEKPDMLAMNDYLNSLCRLEYMKTIGPDDSVNPDYIRTIKPEYVISVKAINAQPVVIKIFPHLHVQADKGNLPTPDPNLFIGASSNEKLPFFARYMDFDPVIRNLSFFLKE